MSASCCIVPAPVVRLFIALVVSVSLSAAENPAGAAEVKVVRIQEQARSFSEAKADIDVGWVTPGQKITFPLLLTNDTGKTLEFLGQRASCSCTVTSVNARVMPPSDAAFIELLFSMKKTSGAGLEVVSLEWMDAETGEKHPFKVAVRAHVGNIMDLPGDVTESIVPPRLPWDSEGFEVPLKDGSNPLVWDSVVVNSDNRYLSLDIIDPDGASGQRGGLRIRCRPDRGRIRLGVTTASGTMTYFSGGRPVGTQEFRFPIEITGPLRVSPPHVALELPADETGWLVFSVTSGPGMRTGISAHLLAQPGSESAFSIIGDGNLLILLIDPDVPMDKGSINAICEISAVDEESRMVFFFEIPITLSHRN